MWITLTAGPSQVPGRSRPVAQPWPGGAGGMQVGAGGEFTWASVTMPFGVVSNPTAWMSRPGHGRSR